MNLFRDKKISLRINEKLYNETLEKFKKSIRFSYGLSFADLVEKLLLEYKEKM